MMHLVSAHPAMGTCFSAILALTYSCVTLDATAVANEGNFQCEARDARLCLLAENDLTAEAEALSLLHRGARALPIATNETQAAPMDNKAKAVPAAVTEVAPAITQTGDKAKVVLATSDVQVGDNATVAATANETAPISETAAPTANVAQTGDEAKVVSTVNEGAPAITPAHETASTAPILTQSAPAIQEAQDAPTGTEAQAPFTDVDKIKTSAEENSIRPSTKDIQPARKTLSESQQLLSMKAKGRMPATWTHVVDTDYRQQIRSGYISVIVIVVICLVLTFIVKVSSWLASVKPVNLLEHEWQQAEVSLREHRATN